MGRRRRSTKTRQEKELELAIGLTGVGVLVVIVLTLPQGRLRPESIPTVVVMGVGLAIVWALAIFSLKLRNARRQTLEQLQALSPTEFEDWVAARFRELGYKVRLTGMGGDHGADLVAEKPGERAIVQCKRYSSWRVGEPALRDLYGAMHDFDVQKGYLVTTGRLTNAARAWARGKPIAIWDGDDLARLAKAPSTCGPAPAPTLKGSGASSAPSSPQGGTAGGLPGASPTHSSPQRGTIGGLPTASPAHPSPQAVGPTCPRCGALLVPRRNGQTGEAFLGCSRFPQCRHTQPLP